MTDKEKKAPPSQADIEMDQFLRGLDTPEGRNKIGDDAYQEALDAEKRGNIESNKKG